MTETNRQIAVIFHQMADVMEILEMDRFRVNAFTRAARALEDMAENVADVGPDVGKLTKIDGIGKGMAHRIAAFLKSGKLKDYEDLMAQIPTSLLDLLVIPGLGPKTIALMWKRAGVESLDELKIKLQSNELADLPGLGSKKLENLRKSIIFAESSTSRIRLGQAVPMAMFFLKAMRQLKSVQQAMYAGSLRRGQETIGDIDIIVAAHSQDASAITSSFTNLAPATDVLAKGPTKTSMRTSDGIQIDLRIVAPIQFGAALMYFTGSKDYNVAMRQRAIGRGLRLNEYGLYKSGVKKLVASKTEQEVFEALGLAWAPPELRENRGELMLAENNQLPDLIEIADIKAELHAHTSASDGHWSIRELALAAKQRGFHTIAVTDHSKNQAQANGLSNERLEKHIKTIYKVRDELKDTIRILAGTEVDILADGKLDYPDSLLKALDIVVASPHTALTQDPKRATTRLIRAIENPYVTILGHPTGRLINRREGLAPNIQQIATAAQARGIAVELNANNWRLDLRDTHARAVIEAGGKLAINTDAHRPDHLDELIYGIMTARRAGATRKDVINCLAQPALAKWLQRAKVS